jgi:hypothetical protein
LAGWRFPSPKYAAVANRIMADLVYNRVAGVVEAHADRLQVLGFVSDRNDAVAHAAAEVWDLNAMSVRAALNPARFHPFEADSGIRLALGHGKGGDKRCARQHERRVDLVRDHQRASMARQFRHALQRVASVHYAESQDYS